MRRQGEARLGTRCKIKNLNSFRFCAGDRVRGPPAEVELLEDGGTIVRRRRLYDSTAANADRKRSKEDAQDYRYFPDPDLSRRWR